MMDRSELMYFEERGRRKHICPEFTEQVRKARNLRELIRLYKKEPTWALSCGYPSWEILKKEGDNPTARSEGLFVDHDLDGSAFTQQVGILHGCRGRIRLAFSPDDAAFPMLYIGNGCDVEVIVDGVCSPIEVFGASRVSVVTANKGKARVYSYDRNNVITQHGANITVTEKE